MKTTETNMPENSKEQEQSESKSQKQNQELIDDVFYVEPTKYGAWKSFHKDGHGLVYALDKEGCISGTRFYLKGCQEGWPDDTMTYDGTVGGKL